MNESSKQSNASNVLFAAGLFVVFGFLVLILSGFAGHDTLEERAYMGDFDRETIETRWANLEEVRQAQSEAFSEEKIDTAMKTVAESSAPSRASTIVVPGSPTFMQQMTTQAQPSEGETEEGSDENVEKDSESEPETAEGEPNGEESAEPEKAEADEATDATEADENESVPAAESGAEPESVGEVSSDAAGESGGETEAAVASEPEETNGAENAND